MIAITETRSGHKSRQVKDVIEYKNELYICVAIGKTRITQNGFFRTNLICQSVTEDDSVFELESYKSAPRIIHNATYQTLELGEFGAVNDAPGRIVRIIGVASLSWVFTDLKVSWLAEPIEPLPRRECIKLIKNYKKEQLHDQYVTSVGQNVIKVSFRKKA